MNQEFDVLNAVKSWRLDDFADHSPSSVINDVYASDVLTLEQLRQRLSRPVFKSLQAPWSAAASSTRPSPTPWRSP